VCVCVCVCVCVRVCVCVCVRGQHIRSRITQDPSTEAVVEVVVERWALVPVS